MPRIQCPAAYYIRVSARDTAAAGGQWRELHRAWASQTPSTRPRGKSLDSKAPSMQGKKKRKSSIVALDIRTKVVYTKDPVYDCYSSLPLRGYYMYYTSANPSSCSQYSRARVENKTKQSEQFAISVAGQSAAGCGARLGRSRTRGSPVCSLVSPWNRHTRGRGLLTM